MFGPPFCYCIFIYSQCCSRASNLLLLLMFSPRLIVSAARTSVRRWTLRCGSSAPPSVLSTHRARAPASLRLLRKTSDKSSVVSVRRRDVTFPAVCSVLVSQTQVSRMLAGKYAKFFFLLWWDESNETSGGSRCFSSVQ